MGVSLYDWCIQNDSNLLNEWDTEKNMPLTPNTVTSKSGKKVYWKCEKKHEWGAVISSRTSGSGCPICNGKKVLAGYNDLATTHPKIAAQWHPIKNAPLTAQSVTRGHNKAKVFWMCEKGHEWEATVASRTGFDLGCPFCSGRYAIPGETDLLTLFPDIAAEWDYEKNSTLQLEQIKPGTHQKVYWKCPNGHSYLASVHSRTNAKSGCPHCSKERHISFPEKAIAFYLMKSGLQIEESYRAPWLGKNELDIYIPSLKLGIEYDGQAWHKSGRKDINKDLLCFQNGVSLIRVREPECPKLLGIGPCYVLPDTNEKSINGAIDFIFNILECEYAIRRPVDLSIDVLSDRISIFELMEFSIKSNSLAAMYPKLVLEWCQEKNGMIAPDHISCKTSKKFYWKCGKCGYIWRTSPSNRVNGTGCPVCVGQVVVPGKNDFFSMYPELASEWNYAMNTNVDPTHIRPGTHLKVFWKCNTCGHEWPAEVKSRVSGRGCPVCAVEKRKKSKATPNAGKSLAEKFPEMIAEWHPLKNGFETPCDVYPGSHKSAWWKCSKCGHEFERKIADHIRSKKCPLCRKGVSLSDNEK